MIRVRYFAAAAEAAGVDEESVTAGTRAELVSVVVGRHGPDLARVLDRCALVAEGRRLDGEDAIDDGALVDVLPPFAGG
ncbi:MoaD/ThiS family protein [Isoptericola sp. b490]|uniref:MoaD/ThiS family protein n=1 Tax=Actinotalea lenta TaxID=3064654 RepID=UPI0027135146|nr:MoaD/ThiS family protein [Isoptericola sp. b490]MDO8121577.1 MoaD/ThiS family protein [Isoptericola sp. b490]